METKVAMMSISEKEQQALQSIEADLAGSCPELATKLAVFTRLTAGEAMPLRERLRRDACPPLAAVPEAGASSQTSQARTRRMRQWLSSPAAWPLVWPLVWVTLTIAFLSVALIASHGAGQGTCTVSQTAACQHARVPAPSGARLARGGQ